MPPKKKPELTTGQRIEFFVLEAATRVGVTGTVILTVMIFFITKGTTEQHKEFFDKFLLLKFNAGDTGYLYFILSCLIVIIAGQSIVYRSRVNIKNKRIEELEKEKEKLQNKLLS